MVVTLLFFCIYLLPTTYAAPTTRFKWYQTLESLHMTIQTPRSSCYNHPENIQYDIQQDRITLYCDNQNDDNNNDDNDNSRNLLSFEFREDIDSSDPQTMCKISLTKIICQLVKRHTHMFDRIASKKDHRRIKKISSIDWTKYQDDEQNDDNDNDNDNDDDDDDDDSDNSNNNNNSGLTKFLAHQNILTIQNATHYQDLRSKFDTLLVWHEFRWCRKCTKAEALKLYDVATTLKSISEQPMDVPSDLPFYPNVQVVRINPMLHRQLARELQIECTRECFVHAVPGLTTTSTFSKSFSKSKKIEKISLKRKSVMNIVQNARQYSTSIISRAESLRPADVMQRFGGHVLYDNGNKMSERFISICSLLHLAGHGGLGIRTKEGHETAAMSSLTRPVGCVHLPTTSSVTKSRLQLMVRTKDSYETVSVPEEKDSILFSSTNNNSKGIDDGNMTAALHNWILRSTVPIMQEMDWKVREEIAALQIPLLRLVVNDEGEIIHTGSGGDTAMINVPTREIMAKQARALTMKVVAKYRGRIACVFVSKTSAQYDVSEYGFLAPVKTVSLPLLVISDTANDDSLHFAYKPNTVNNGVVVNDGKLTDDIVLHHVDQYFAKQLQVTRKTQQTSHTWSKGSVKAIVYDTLDDDLSTHSEVLLVLVKDFLHNKDLQDELSRTALALSHATDDRVIVAVYNTGANYYHEELFPLIKEPIDRRHQMAEFIYVTKSPPSMIRLHRSRKSRQKRAVPHQQILNKFIQRQSKVLLEMEMESTVNADASREPTTLWSTYISSINVLLKAEKSSLKNEQARLRKMEMLEEYKFEQKMIERGLLWEKKMIIKKTKKNLLKANIIKYLNHSDPISAAENVDKRPREGSKVNIISLGIMLDGTVADKLEDDSDMGTTFIAGRSEVIPCWDRGVLEMIQGESAWFHCPASTAWGREGFPPKIPPNTTLTVWIKLRSVEHQ